VIFLCISLVSDVLDGNIARYFKLQTHFGAALDNLADICTYAMALLGLFQFKWTEIEPHAWLLYLFLTVFVLSYIVAFTRFGKIPGLHLYSAVSAGYIQSIFFFSTFRFRLLYLDVLPGGRLGCVGLYRKDFCIASSR
jgi:CDP-alcohol phosphatidyltransferase.